MPCETCLYRTQSPALVRYLPRKVSEGTQRESSSSVFRPRSGSEDLSLRTAKDARLEAVSPHSKATSVRGGRLRARRGSQRAAGRLGACRRYRLLRYPLRGTYASAAADEGGFREDLQEISSPSSERTPSIKHSPPRQVQRVFTLFESLTYTRLLFEETFSPSTGQEKMGNKVRNCGWKQAVLAFFTVPTSRIPNIP